VGRDVDAFLNRASGVPPHKHVRSFCGIVENLGHGPRGQKWNLFAVYPAPEKPPFVPLHVQLRLGSTALRGQLVGDVSRAR
jgi:hypothetical protein